MYASAGRLGIQRGVRVEAVMEERLEILVVETLLRHRSETTRDNFIVPACRFTI
jgi:hypothetical protein